MPEEKHCHEICIVLGFATLLAASCAETRREAPEGAVKVGLLIPFSGEQASKGINFERAVTMLADAINDHGGIDGHVLWIETRDTHSDVEVGLRSAADLIENEKVSALIGPDDAELIKRMQPLVESAGISEILPEMVSKTSVTSSDGLWFRIAPSVELMGCALAQEIYNRQLRRVFVIYSKKLEWKAMAAGMSDTFEWYHNGSSEKALTQIVEIDEASTAVTELYSLVSEFRPDTIVMITSPFAGSEIVQGLANFLGKAHWYLGPELDSQVLFDNTPPGALNGSYVVNTEIANQSEGDKFKALFTDAWNDVPFEAAYFYYDALAVLSIAAAWFHSENLLLNGAQVALVGASVLTTRLFLALRP